MALGRIYVTVLTTANKWYEVLTPVQAKYIKAFKIKSRYTHGQTAPRPFDYAFSETPDAGASTGTGFWSNSGAGSGDEAGPTSGVWARSAVAGTTIEVMTYD